MDPGRRRATVRLSAPLAVLSILSLLGTGLMPALAPHHPLLLVALAPRSVYVLAVAAHAPLVPLVVVAAVRLMVADPFHFRLGRMHGAALARRAERWIPLRSAGAALVVASPTGKVLALAGAAGVPVRRVAAADAAGTLVRLALLVGAGRAVAPWTEQALRAVAPLAVALPVALLICSAGVAGCKAARRWTPGWAMKEATCVSW